MSTLDGILADTRTKIDTLRRESAEESREATTITEQMAEPTARHRTLQAEHRDLLLKLGALQDEIHAAASALEAMADERDRHLRNADAAADAADHYEQVTLPQLAAILDGAELPPHEALAATGLMVEEPKQVDPRDRPATCAEMGCTSCLGCDGCTCHNPDDDDDLPFNVVQAPGDVVAALTGGIPVIAPATPDKPVATAGPGITMPDLGPKRPPLDPPPGKGTHTHAKPGGLARVTGGWPVVGRRRKNDEQDGDA